MSTPGNPISPTSPDKILSALSTVNGTVSMVLELANGEIIPLGKWLVQEFKQLAESRGTVDYQVLLSSNSAELAVIRSQGVEDLEAVNAELARQNAPVLAIPPKPAEE